MESFTPVAAAIGGVLIGLSAVLLMGLNGRIAGISGVLSGAVFAERGDKMWQAAFIVGLIVAPALWTRVSGAAPPFTITSNWMLIGIGGLLVGFGTRLGSGCTSGHGICGLSRLSPRSMASVSLFIAAGMATVAIAKSLFGS